MVYEYSALSNGTDKLISRYRDERKQKLVIGILKKRRRERRQNIFTSRTRKSSTLKKFSRGKPAKTNTFPDTSTVSLRTTIYQWKYVKSVLSAPTSPTYIYHTSPWHKWDKVFRGGKIQDSPDKTEADLSRDGCHTIRRL